MSKGARRTRSTSSGCTLASRPFKSFNWVVKGISSIECRLSEEIQLRRWKFKSMVATPAAVCAMLSDSVFLAERGLQVLALGDVRRACR